MGQDAVSDGVRVGSLLHFVHPLQWNRLTESFSGTVALSAAKPSRLGRTVPSSVSMVPEKGGARFYCHLACLEQRLHWRAKEVIRRD